MITVSSLNKVDDFVTGGMATIYLLLRRTLVLQQFSQFVALSSRGTRDLIVQSFRSFNIIEQTVLRMQNSD